MMVAGQKSLRIRSQNANPADHAFQSLPSEVLDYLLTFLPGPDVFSFGSTSLEMFYRVFVKESNVLSKPRVDWSDWETQPHHEEEARKKRETLLAGMPSKMTKLVETLIPLIEHPSKLLLYQKYMLENTIHSPGSIRTDVSLRIFNFPPTIHEVIDHSYEEFVQSIFSNQSYTIWNKKKPVRWDDPANLGPNSQHYEDAWSQSQPLEFKTLELIDDIQKLHKICQPSIFKEQAWKGINVNRFLNRLCRNILHEQNVLLVMKRN
eukprot:TRINITY_DN10618_c0_g1_i2.p1 TRINITY_DN10618_c0_g1~~TRINITY_DN10618_c0_g1_i2.p1  ORF type:complete len:283 (+),score=14.52 TRINITY_DN10618_c0_g1_i2:62-850(+)